MGSFLWRAVRRRRRARRAPAASYVAHKEETRRLIHERLAYWAPIVGVAVGRIAIRDTRRSWGSCSSKGNLNFSYKLLFLPTCWREYIIVHELCHLHHLNHSQDFWNEVEKILPNYREQMLALRRFERTHGTALVTLQKYQREHQCAYCEMVSL